MMRRSEKPYDRYGMDNEDWCHLDQYWLTMYGDEYPHEREWERGHQAGMYRKWRPRHYQTVEVYETEDLKRAA